MFNNFIFFKQDPVIRILIAVTVLHNIYLDN